MPYFPHTGTILLIALGLLLLACAAAAGVGWIAGGVTGPTRHGRKSIEAQRARSRKWASLRDVKKLRDDGPSPSRVRLCELQNRQLYNETNRSLMVVAPSGAGKTPRVVVPICVTHDGPAVITSVKADVLSLTYADREKRGPVWVFDPTESQGLTAHWSPIARVRTWADALDAAHWIQDCAGRDALGGVENAKFWEDQARFLLAPLVFYAARSGGTIVDVARMLSSDDGTRRDITDGLAVLGDPDAIAYWTQFDGLDPRTRSNVIATATSIIEPWRHPRIRNAVEVHAGEDALDLDFITQGRGTLYLVSPAAEQSQFTAIFTCLVNAIAMKVEREAQRRGGLPLERPLLLMLDEAANIAPLPKLDEVASKAAGEGMIVVSVWQDLGQIEKIYGPARTRTIISNHFAKVYLPGISDQATLEQLSQAVGRDMFVSESASWSEQGRSSTVSEHELAVAPPDWLRRLPVDTAIVLVSRYPAIQGQIPAWFEDPGIRARIDPHVAKQFDDFYGGADRQTRRLPHLPLRAKTGRTA